MQARKSAKVVVGLLTMWPLGYGLAFAVCMLLAFAGVFGERQLAPLFPYMIMLHLGTVVVIAASVTTCIVHACRNEILSTDLRIVWISLLVIAGFFFAPAYWWLHIRRSDAADGSQNLRVR